MKKRLYLLIILAHILFVSCSKKDIATCNPDSKINRKEWCEHESNHSCSGYAQSCIEYICHTYRPVLSRNPTGDPNGEILINPTPCPNSARLRLEDLPDESFALVDSYNQLTHGVTLATAGSSRFYANVKDLKEYKNNPNKYVEKYPMDTDGLWSIYKYNVHPLYAEYIEYAQKWDADPSNAVEKALKGFCYANFKCLPQSLLDKSNCGTLKGTRSFIGCPGINSPINHKSLPDFSEVYNNDPVLFPTLSNEDGSKPYPPANYILDLNKDVQSGLGSNTALREVYAKVTLANGTKSKLGTDIDFNHRFRLALYGPQINDTSFINLEGKNSPYIRGCRNERDTLQYIVKMPLLRTGTYNIRLFDLDQSEPANCTPISGFKCVAENSFRVGSFDNYARATTSINDFTKRELNLISINHNTPSITALSQLKTKAWTNLKDVLEDAFSLNFKMSNLSKSNTIQRGITVNILEHNSTPAFLDEDGNFKINIERLNRIYLTTRNARESYNLYLSEQLFYLYENINGSLSFHPSLMGLNKEDLTKAIALYIDGIILTDKVGLPLSIEPGGAVADYPLLESPNKFFFSNNNLVLGFSGPVEFPDDYSGDKTIAMRLMNASLLFKKSHSKFIQGKSISTDNAVAITLAHELGHVWAQQLMVTDNSNGARAHQDRCGGYNEKNCVFRYDNHQMYSFHDSYGIVYCETHRQILLNQLFRKYYKFTSFK